MIKKRIDENGRDKQSNSKEGIEIEIGGNGFQNDTSLPKQERLASP